MKGRKLDELHEPKRVREIRSKIKKARARQVFPIKDSSIEVKIQDFLKEMGIEFYTHQQVCKDHAYQCDILIPSMNLIIECDGDYWHGNLEKFGDWRHLNQMQREQKIKDYLRTAELQSLGYAILRLWEKQIKRMRLLSFQKNLYSSLTISKQEAK